MTGAPCKHVALRASTGGRCPICHPISAADMLRPMGAHEVRGDALLELGAPLAEIRREQLERARDPERAPQVIGQVPLEAQEDILRRLSELDAEIAEQERILGVSEAADLTLYFGSFLRGAWHAIAPRRFVETLATEAIGEHLQAVAHGEIDLLAIAIGPGSGKSSLVSVAFPAFMWARDPTWKVICASHAFDLSRDIAQRFARLVMSDWYLRTFPHVDVVGTALKSLSTSVGGMRYAVGLDSALTGLRARAGIVDDSLNANDAHNPDAVKKANEWFGQAFSSRFDEQEGGGKPPIVVVQQKLAENDMIQLVADLGGEVLSLPARFDPRRRSKTKIWQDPRIEPGELLAPEVQSAEYLATRERQMTAREFATQFDQRVAPREGNRFKVHHWGWFNLDGDERPRERPVGSRATASITVPRDLKTGAPIVDWACLSIDATGGSTNEDASALGLGLVCGRGNRRLVFRDFTEGPAGWTETLRRVERAIREAGSILVKQKKLVVLLEKKAMGASEDAPLPTQVRAMIAGDAVRPDGSKIPPFTWADDSKMIVKLELYEPTGKGSKEIRADALEVEVEAGLVCLLDGASWVPAFVDEHALFPFANRDDRVDLMGQVIDHYREGIKESFLARSKRRRR